MTTALAVQETALTVEEDRAARQLAAVKQIISQTTPAKEIRTRKGRGGMVFKYTDGAYVIRTLNEALGHNWDFEADNEQVIEWNGVPFEVRCRGRLTVRLNGQAVTKVQYGSQLIEFVKDRSGVVIAPVSIGDCFKGAATDAMKKCASLLGVALDLYDSDYKAENYADDEDVDRFAAAGMGDRAFRKSDDPRPKTLGELVTPKQLWTIRNMERETGTNVDELCREKFRCDLAEISKKAASVIIDALKGMGAKGPAVASDAEDKRIKEANAKHQGVITDTGPSKDLMRNPNYGPEIAKRFNAVVQQLTIRGIPPDELLREANVCLHDAGRKQIRSRYEADDESARIICDTFEVWAMILDRKQEESRATQS